MYQLTSHAGHMARFHVAQEDSGATSQNLDLKTRLKQSLSSRPSFAYVMFDCPKATIDEETLHNIAEIKVAPGKIHGDFCRDRCSLGPSHAAGPAAAMPVRRQAFPAIAGPKARPSAWLLPAPGAEPRLSGRVPVPGSFATVCASTSRCCARRRGTGAD